MPKLQTIYQYFSSFTKEQINAALERLSEEEKSLITLRYGEDLDNPISGKLNKEQSNKFYGSLVPKLRRLLVNSNRETKKPKKEKRTTKREQNHSIMESANGIPTSVIKETLVESQKRSISNIEMLNPQKEPQSEYIPADSNVSSTSKIQDDSKNITKEDYEKILELLRIPTFSQMLSVLTAKEAIIISLKLGYVDGKYFSSDSIAKFLGIEICEVIETTKKVLLLFKESINEIIDTAIEKVACLQKK